MLDLSNDTMIHVKKGKIEYLQFRELLKYENKLQHCYTLKGEKQDYKEIQENNYRSLYECLELELEGLSKIECQVHGNKVEKVKKRGEFHTNIDGLITSQKGISLSLRFADCTPILFYDPIQNAIGNIHSGWRGTVQKIGQQGALKMMEEYKSKPEDLICCIGPCISKCHFEVGEEVKNIFEETFSYLRELDKMIQRIEKKEEEKYWLDTTQINRKLLEEIGVLPQNIIQSNICTVCHWEQIHSYRKEKELSGRNTAIIGLKN